MNRQAAGALLAAFYGLGLRRLVLCPGSRSGPLALAAAALEPHGLQLFTAIDERSAAFFALGLARADGLPAAVVTTSGTAVAELLPAAVEADRSALPLLLLSADRPERLKNCGANQTVNQEAFLLPVCRLLLQGPMAGLHGADDERLATLARTAWRHCLGVPAGPVHVNLPFEEPLHAEGASVPAPAAGDDPGLAAPVPAPASAELDPDQPGVIIAGPWRRGPAAAFAGALRRLCRRTGWPVLADPASGLRGLPLPVVAGYDALLADPALVPAVRQVLRLGPLPASRRLHDWLAGLDARQLLVTEGDPRPLDPLNGKIPQLCCGLEAWQATLPAGAPSEAGAELGRQWLQAEERLQAALDSSLESDGSLSEPALARWLQQQLPAGLPVMLANSSPVRDWESWAGCPQRQRPVVSFRGASGIDGTLSLAAGLAAAWGTVLLVTGDLALLHDSNGWLWRQELARRAPAARLRVLLIDNGGGGLFEQLPIPRQGLDFERLFAMPQAVDHQALAAAHGVPTRRGAERLLGLEADLEWLLADDGGEPLRLLRLSTERAADARLRSQLLLSPAGPAGWWQP
ncbi:MAG: 2-succinyl-5-enolpyruvyl-6-hydroxy-3-cyclohexene-1-carboxylic-acid synthase [Cyanobacteriota bacterium]